MTDVARERVVARAPEERVGSGQAGDLVVAGIPQHGVRVRGADHVLHGRSTRQPQRQAGHKRLRGRDRQIEDHPAVEEPGEIELVAVDIRRLDDRHVRRLRPPEHVPVAPGAARKDGIAHPSVECECVGSFPSGEPRRFDAREALRSEAGQQPCREREVDVPRLDHGIDAGSAVEGVVPAAAGECVIAGEPGDRVVVGIADERVGERRADHVAEADDLPETSRPAEGQVDAYRHRGERVVERVAGRRGHQRVNPAKCHAADDAAPRRRDPPNHPLPGAEKRVAAEGAVVKTADDGRDRLDATGSGGRGGTEIDVHPQRGGRVVERVGRRRGSRHLAGKGRVPDEREPIGRLATDDVAVGREDEHVLRGAADISDLEAAVGAHGKGEGNGAGGEVESVPGTDTLGDRGAESVGEPSELRQVRVVGELKQR